MEFGHIVHGWTEKRCRFVKGQVNDNFKLKDKIAKSFKPTIG